MKEAVSEIIRFAIVGFGHIGKCYAKILNINGNSALVAIIDPSTSSNALGEYDIPKFTSLNDFFCSRIIADVIIIASPNGYHAAQASQVLKQGKHVIIEKPLALNADDAQLLVEEASKRNLKIFPVVQNRYAAVSVWLKDLIDSGTLGDIFMVQVNCYWNRDERYYNNAWRGSKHLDGGTLFTQFYHFIDMLFWLFGDIHNILARFSDFTHQKLTEFEDSGIVNFDFHKGGMGCINYSTAVWSKNLESSLTIIAQNGSVKIGGQYMEKIECCTIKDYTLPEFGADKELPNAPFQNHYTVISDVINILKGGESTVPSAEEGIKAIDIICRIYAFRDNLTNKLSTDKISQMGI